MFKEGFGRQSCTAQLGVCSKKGSSEGLLGWERFQLLFAGLGGPSSWDVEVIGHVDRLKEPNCGPGHANGQTHDGVNRAPLQAADCWVGSGTGDRSAAHDSQLRQLWGVQERREVWDGRLAPS